MSLLPRYVLIAGVFMLVTGLVLNYTHGLKGVLHLQSGKVNKLVSGMTSSPDNESVSAGLGYKVTLDSVKVHSHTPKYELKLWKRDSMPANPHVPSTINSKTLVSTFPLEPMKIQKVEESDLRFRLKAFYPDFEFAYEYPQTRDTIMAKAPGITLRLKTKEGEPIVTLLSEKPGPNKLDDIVSLGASLDFYWEFAEDSLNTLAASGNLTGNKIVFYGASQKVYFILDGLLTEHPLKENSFYNMPGQDSIGFTILYCFPDAAYLKAVPATKGSAVNNPVAHVEIWKEGGSAKDAFVYPETMARKGGDFAIPFSVYKIGMDVVHRESVKYCDCYVTVQADSSDPFQSLVFLSGKPERYNGYLFTPLECHAGAPGMVTMQVSKHPGRLWIILGSGLGLIAFLSLIFIHKSSKN